MRYLVIVIISTIFLFSCNSNQSEQSEDNIIFLDGVKVSKSLIVNSCLKYIKKEGMDKLIIAENYCNCFAERLGENFKLTDVSFLFENIESEKELYSAGISFYNLPGVKEITENCIRDNLADSNENIFISSEEEKEVLITVFKNALKTQEGYEELEQMLYVDDYCECVVIKVLENFSYKEIMTDPNFGENSKYIQIQEDCVFKHKKESVY